MAGVSTGALIAPYAFLGSAWDGKLVEAYRGLATDKLMVSRGLGISFGSSVFEGGPLRDVLAASASVPGVFPPVMIDVEKDGWKLQEMHVDGGASTPFFIAPDVAMILGYAPENLHSAHIYVVVVGQASSAPRTTLNSAVDIASRSSTTVMNHLTRTALAQTEICAKRNDMTFLFTMIPPDVAFSGPLAFDQAGTKAHLIMAYDALRSVRPGSTRSRRWTKWMLRMPLNR